METRSTSLVLSYSNLVADTHILTRILPPCTISHQMKIEIHTENIFFTIYSKLLYQFYNYEELKFHSKKHNCPLYKNCNFKFPLLPSHSYFPCVCCVFQSVSLRGGTVLLLIFVSCSGSQVNIISIPQQLAGCVLHDGLVFTREHSHVHIHLRQDAPLLQCRDLTT